MDGSFTQAQKNRARSAVHTALNSGKLIKAKRCEMCNKLERLEGHHPDYSKPLEVLWVGKDCHKQLHTGIGFSETTERLTVNVRIGRGTAHRLKLRAAKEGKTMMQLIEELSKQKEPTSH